jgi:hypothetical protein
MATVRISQLTAITTPTDDDILIINDADTNTRKITFANLTQGLLNTGSTLQTKTGPLTVQGVLTAGGNFVVDTNTFFVDAVNNRVGVKTSSPDVEFDVDGVVRVRNANSLQFGDSDNSNWVALKSPGVVPSNITLTLPSALPSATNLVTADTAGTLSYTSGIAFNSGDSSLDLGAIKLTNQGSVRFYEDSTNGSEYIQLNAPASLATTNTYSLPSAYPAASGYVLSSDTSGILTWVTNAAGAAGATAQIQYNDGTGVLAADADFTFQSGTNTMSVPNATITTLLDAQGDVDLGNAVTDTVTITGVVDSDIIPSAGTEALGSATARWAEVHTLELLTDKTITGGGTTGAQTINKIAGSVNFGAADTSLVVTNSLVTSNSVIIATVATNDATMTSVQAVAAAGSFTLHANAAATAETRVNFVAIN